MNSHRLHPPPTGAPVRGLLIVARDLVDLYEFLQRVYGDSAELTLLLDRREGERRHTVHPVPVDRRRWERRSAPGPADDLRLQPYILTRPYDRRPHD